MDLIIGIAPSTSSSVNDTIKNFVVKFAPNEKYVAVANGVLNPANFSANPNGRSIAFTIFAKDKIRENGTSSSYVDAIIVHGSTDAPTVDVNAKSSGSWWPTKLVNNASYGDITSYKKLSPKSYILDVTPGNSNAVVASFTANLTGLGGGAAVVFASGFLNPSANQNGSAFGLFAALPNGTVVEFPKVLPKARLQVIHNAADVLAGSVDVYVNGSLLLNNFEFRKATPFIDVPAEVVLNIGIAPGTSTSVNDTIKNFPVTLQKNKTYVAVANGVLNSSLYAANPDGKNISFTLFAKDGVKEKASSNSKVDFIVLHGSTDAPTVDVLARGVGNLVDNAAYGDFTNYLSVPASKYILDITPGNNNSAIVASFDADLRTLGGKSAIIFASGFLNPAANQNGASFGLFAALANGTVVALPLLPSTARLQVIHNAADPGASSVDVYLNGALALDNFMFRKATPYIDVPGNTPINVGIAPPNSSSVNDTIKNFTATFLSGGTYVVLANGVLNPSSFASNPNGRDISFTLFAKDNARETSSGSNRVDVFAVHGSTDAPTVDIYGLGLVLRNVSYGDISNYVSLSASRNWLLVTTPSPFRIVGVFSTDLRTLGGKSAVVFASGFLTPSANQNGPSFGLYAALPDGNVAQLPRIFGKEADNFAKEVLGQTDVAVVSDFSLAQNYPNPFNPTTNIRFAIPQSSFVTLKVYNILGKEIATLVNEQKESGIYDVNFDASNLASGVYVYKIQAGNFSATKKLTLMK